MTTPTVRPPMNKRTRFNLWFWFIALIGLFSFQSWLAVQNAVEPVPYSEFQRYLKEGWVEEIAVSNQDVRGRLKKPLSTDEQYFVTTRVDPELAANSGPGGAVGARARYRPFRLARSVQRARHQTRRPGFWRVSGLRPAARDGAANVRARSPPLSSSRSLG